MEFEIEKETLINSLNWVSKVFRNSLPIESSIKIQANKEGLKLTGSSVETTTITKELISIIKEGELLIPGEQFINLIKVLPNTKIHIQKEESKLKISYNKSFYKLPILTEENYLYKEQSSIKLGRASAKDVIKAISQASIAAAKEETTPALMSVKLIFTKDKITFLAIDRYRIAKKEIKWKAEALKNDVETLIKHRTITDIAKNLENKNEVSFFIDSFDESKKITLESDNYSITTLLTSGNLPPTESLFKQEYKEEITIKKAALVDVLNRFSSPPIGNNTAQINFNIKKNIISVTIQNKETDAYEEIPCNYKGDDIDISFNLGYIKEGVNQITEEDIVIKVEEPSKPVKIVGIKEKEESKDYQYIIVPIKKL